MASLESRLTELSQQIAAIGGLPEMPNDKVSFEQLRELNQKINSITKEVLNTLGAKDSEAFKTLVEVMHGRGIPKPTHLEARLDEFYQQLFNLDLSLTLKDKLTSQQLHGINHTLMKLTIETLKTPGASESEAWKKLQAYIERQATASAENVLRRRQRDFDEGFGPVRKF